MHPSTGAAPRRRLFVSTPALPSRARAPIAPPRMRRAVATSVEHLEPRSLFAVTLPAGFQESLVVSGFGEPTDAAFAPDGRIFITEKSGAVRLFDHGSLHASPFLTVPVDTYRDRGLDAILLDPNFSTNGFLYLYYTNADPSQPNTAPNGATNRLSRFKVDPANSHHALAGSEKVLIDNIPSNTGFHIGGLLEFGPDGKIYLGTGDGGPAFGQSSSGIPSYAQDLGTLAGKILRINPDGSIPTNNPFAGQSGKRGEIWAYGLRNPFSGAVHPTTGLLYANDVGQADWEEINDIRKGLNFGWPGAEGISTNPAYTNPVHVYGHDPLLTYSACVTGGTFYTGASFPSQYAGDYFFTDFVQGWMKTYDPATGQVSNFASGLSGPIRMETAADGSIYYLAHDSRSVHKISYVGAANRPPAVVATANVTSGLSPLTVQFDGGGSSDPDGDSLTYTWEFGDGTTGTGRTVSHTYTGGARTFSATLTVSDGRGGSAQSSPMAVTLGNRAPQATISVPAAGMIYTAGDIVSFSGAGTDAEDGSLPASAFRWSVAFHHHDHTHGFIDSIPGVKSGSFTIPTDGEVAADQWYRIHLTVTDSAGLEHTSHVDVMPRTSTVRLATNVPGLSVNLDGQPMSAPASFTGVAGMVRTLSAPPTQVVNGVSYTFSSWSDGGAATHSISTPAADATFTANYVVSPARPFGGTPVRVPGRIEAEHFDDGGEGVSWHEVFDAFEPAVSPYRNGGVDLEPVGGSASAGYNVGYVKAGEWLEYTVDVRAGGVYDIDFRVGNKGAGGIFHLEVDGVGVTGPLEIPDTGDWQNYTTITRTGVALTAGRHVLRLVADAQNAAGYAGNFDWFHPRATFDLPPPPPPPAAAGGLKAMYFDDAKMKVPKVTRVDAAVDFDWAAGSPDAGVGADTFSARWTGQVLADAAGTYTFSTASDDGVRLWVDGVLVINNWKQQKKGPAQRSGEITLAAGQKYDLRMEYFDKTGNAVARLSWATPGVAQEVIPASHLSPQSPVRVNAGGRSYTDRSRKVFAADAGFSGGKVSNKAFAVNGTADDRLYSAHRSGQSFSYAATGLVDGSYTVRLHFADPTSTAPGQRVFDVVANGQPVLQGFDPVAEAGARTALVKTVTAVVQGGRLDLLFTGVTGDAIVSAIELLPA